MVNGGELLTSFVRQRRLERPYVLPPITIRNISIFLNRFSETRPLPSRGSKQPKHHPRRAVLPSHQNQPSIPAPAGRQAQTKTAANARSVAVYNDNDMAERSGFVSFVKEIGEKGRCLQRRKSLKPRRTYITITYTHILHSCKHSTGGRALRGGGSGLACYGFSVLRFRRSFS